MKRLVKENGIHRLKDPICQDIIEPTLESLVTKLTANDLRYQYPSGLFANLGGTAEI